MTEFCRRDRLLLLRGASSKVCLRKGGMVVFERFAFHPDICFRCQVQLARLSVGSGDWRVGRNGPHIGAVTRLHEEFVEGEFNRGADDVERI